MRESKTQQLFRQLRERIESGIYPVGSRFPSEDLLADEFEVNKKTANKAVDTLVSTGWSKTLNFPEDRSLFFQFPPVTTCVF